MRNALTIDVEDWFHVTNLEGVVDRDRWDEYPSRVVDSTRRLLDLCEEHGSRATCFVLGWVAERHPELVEEIASRGHELASHGYGHRLVYELTPETFAEDLDRSRRFIRAAVDVPLRGYRAPSFSIDRRNPWAFDVLVAQGFEYDSSLFPVHHPRYGVPGFSRVPRRLRAPGGGELEEFPMTTLRAFGRNWGASGGGYLRLLPIQVLEAAFARMNEAGQPAVLYLHPWEIDPDQPRVPVRGLGRVTHYTNLSGTVSRLRRLFRRFEFGTMVETLRTAPDLRRDPVEAPS